MIIFNYYNINVWMFFVLLLETTTVKSTLPASTLSETTGEK